MVKNKIVVGILPTYDNSDINPYKDIDRFIRMYEEIIVKCGAIPIGLLNKDITMYKDIVDAYLWPGGKIIVSDLYKIFDDVLVYHKPLLGVCLGMQAINTYFNILEDQESLGDLSLIEVYNSKKLDDVYLKKLSGDSLNLHDNLVSKNIDTINSAKHKIKIKKDTFMYDIYKKEEIDVVSMHSYIVARTCTNVNVSSLSNDNVVESIEYSKDNNYILGIQYHPEIINDYKPFLWLIENAYNKYKILVNKENKVPSNLNYKMVYYNSSSPLCKFEESCLEENTLEAFLKLKKKMNSLGYIIDLESGYRTNKLQENLYNSVNNEKGARHADLYVARPGYSEHETGLAIDICGFIDGTWYNEFAAKLDKMYKVLHKVCAEFGFILRYPKGKESITKYAFEPWHLRYVGSIKLAKQTMRENKVLEELKL